VLFPLRTVFLGDLGDSVSTARYLGVISSFPKKFRIFFLKLFFQKPE